MTWLGTALAGTAAFALSGALAAVAPAWVTAGVSVLAGGLLVAGGLGTLFGLTPPPLSLAWAVPGGSFDVVLDPLAGAFLVPMGALGALGAVYATRYWDPAKHALHDRVVRGSYGVLVAAMALTVLARNGVVFLAAWEVMAVSAFFLIITAHQKADVRADAFVYLVATHASTLLLWVVFARTEAATGTFGFARLPSGGASLVTWLLALGAFGVKAGVMPLHVWLPGAHASAPTHVSALLSGVLLKVGVYGIVRASTLLTDPPVAAGGLVLLLGAVSAVGGVAFALGQHDLKRLLAYHSIENIGIILLGLGLALLGTSLDRPDLIVLGASGALLHVWNHAFFKGLLFFAGGAVIHATDTRMIDQLGGLAKRMPATATLFLVGAVAICGLPPLNGFVSELFVYLGLFRSAEGAMFASFTAPVLAFVGALAVACFVKVFGAVFLGTPRGPAPGRAHEAPAAMLVPMVFLAVVCVLIGLAPGVLAPGLDRAVASFAGGASLPRLASLVPFARLSTLAASLVAATAALALWLHVQSRGRSQVETVTWDCGYAAASPRIQYTASSFAESLVGILSGVLRPRVHAPTISGLFPAPSRMETHVDDAVLEDAVRPAFLRAGALLARVHAVQGGRVQVYVLYVALATLALLLAALPVGPALRALWNG